jgi:hypothetical protein
MPLFILYMYQASSYPAISRDNYHLQIGCHKTYAIGSCVERPIGKLSEFDIRYQPVKVVKGQALADLIAERVNTNIAALSIRAWAMYFDGSVCGDGCGIGILLVSPRGQRILFQSDCLPLAPITSQNMKRCVKVWNCFWRPELKQWKFLGTRNW